MDAAPVSPGLGDMYGGATVYKAPAASADSLLREAVAALDTCLASLAQLDERARALSHEAEAAHRLMQQRLHDFGVTSPPTGENVQLPLRPSAGPYVVDHEAIYRDELAMQQTIAGLRSLQVKVDYLTNLMRSGKAQVLGSDPEGLAAAPWAAAVRAARIQAQEEERMRLAREVHDGPAQVLANAILGLEYCELVAARAPEELGPELQRLRTAMREGLVEVRRFMFDLRPSMLATMGLNATLARYVEEYQQAFGIPVRLALPPQELTVDDGAQIVLFRVVQESLQNIQKHAEATAVQVELSRLPDGRVRLLIRDNGKGFDRQRLRPAGPSGAGLLGMEERATLLGGQLTIESALGRGTSVTLELPPPASPAEPDPPEPDPPRSPLTRRRAPVLDAPAGGAPDPSVGLGPSL
jgi:two-component system sensor histidine kinase DegS